MSGRENVDITYDYYRIFYYAAKYRSFSKAAAVLMSNQPNVTRAMNNLENQLGCKLFIRSNRGVSLTVEGEKLFIHVEAAYHHLHSAELELLSDKSLDSGTVTISVTETALHLFLLPILSEFRKEHPGIRLCVFNYSTSESVKVVKDGMADFAVVTSPVICERPLRCVSLRSFEDVLVCSSTRKDIGSEKIHLKDIEDQSLISMKKGTATYDFYSEFYFRNGLPFEVDIEVATIDQILPMVIHDLGIGFLPREIVEGSIRHQKVKEVELIEKIPEREICLIEGGTINMGMAADTLRKLLYKYRKKTGIRQMSNKNEKGKNK